MDTILRRTGLALALLLLPTGCSPPPVEPPRLVLLYAPCTINKGTLSPYRADVTWTPRLRALAERARVFERHQTEAGQSGIAFASLFTGSQADHHGVWRHPAKLSGDLLLVFEAFGQAGYEPFYWNGHAMASPRLHYAQGVPNRNRLRGPLEPGDPRFRRLLDRLAGDPEARALVVTNYKLGGNPYTQQHLAAFRKTHPELFRGLTPGELRRYLELWNANAFALTWNHPKTVSRLGLDAGELTGLARVLELVYLSNIAHLDTSFGRILDEIEARGLRDQSLVVFTADHGEVLYRDSAPFQWSHSMQLAPEVLGVPLLVSAPGLAPGRYSGVTRSIDVFPTLLGLVGISLPPESGVQGVDLSAALRGEVAEPELAAFSHTTTVVGSVYRQMHSAEHREGWAHAARFFPTPDIAHIWVGLRRGDTLHTRRKLDGETWGFEVFDLARGSWQPTRLHAGPEPSAASAARELERYRSRLEQAYAGSAADRQARQLVAAEEARALRELGYIR